MVPRRVCPVYQAVLFLGVLCSATQAEIPKPKDAPQPLAPDVAAREFHVPAGLQVDLVASEPLVQEPTGVCWDAHGRMFVCELHGYNLAGQLAVDALNATDTLDHSIGFVYADEQQQKRARAETYGTIKLLMDNDGDGRIDAATVWVDRLPACHGICAARDGIIATCGPDIIYLADRDGDGRAEIQEVLYTGFSDDMLERSIGCPRWGIDNWIYAGRGNRACRVTGPHLTAPVDLPHTDFRFRPDGTALEPVAGNSYSMGFAITETGDRYVLNTNVAGIFVAPIPWRYLIRNANQDIGSLEQVAFKDKQVYPLSEPHPWRTRRAEDPEFSKFMTKRYGAAETAPNGYLTSGCSPLVYQGHALVGLEGQYFVCEPAQNLLLRTVIKRNGVGAEMHRAAGEEKTEFLSTRDAWFHPVSLTHGPDDSIYISDFYREIIEDYAAVPRYLQQEYGVINGHDHGRLWRITAKEMPAAQSPDMADYSPQRLVAELESPNYWRRETARRLLFEHADPSSVAPLVNTMLTSQVTAAVLSALSILDAQHAIDSELLERLLAHPEPAVRVHALRIADRRPNDEHSVRDAILKAIDDPEPTVLLQAALSLGELRDPRVVPALARLACEHGDVEWMPVAIVSSVSGRGGKLLNLLLNVANEELAGSLGHANAILTPLCSAIAACGNRDEFSQALVQISNIKALDCQLACLRGVQKPFRRAINLDVTDDARIAVLSMAQDGRGDAKQIATKLVTLLKIETAAGRKARLENAARQLADSALPTAQRLDALGVLNAENDAAITEQLLAAVRGATPQLREAIIGALLANRERWGPALDAIEAGTFPAAALSAIQRATLLESSEKKIRERAQRVLASRQSSLPENMPQFLAALKGPRNAPHGQTVFQEKCASCHAVRDIGFAVGPDLTAEFQRAEETIVRDIMLPSEAIAAGYVTYIVETTDGQILTGLIADDSANSITLRQPGGKNEVVLRKDIALLSSSPISMMPDELGKNLTPQDIADVITWIRKTP